MKGNLMRTAVAGIVTAVALTAAGAASAAPPQTVSPPTIEGTPIVGNTLTAGNGLWSGSAMSFTYQWLTCDGKGASCTSNGKTTKTYSVGKGDVGHTLVVLVTAKNTDGTGTANSHPSQVVTTATAPVPSTAPSIKGSAIVGQQLLADPGTYTGAPPTSYSFRWQRCSSSGTGCGDIAGATGQTYGVLTVDVAHTLRVVVKATNQYGTTTMTSKQSDLVAAVAAPPTTTTLQASASTTICCQTVTLSGTVSPVKAGQAVSIFSREASDNVDRFAVTATTDAAGNWSAKVTPMIRTTYYAQISAKNSSAVEIGVHPRVGFGVAGNTFTAKVTARDSFGGRIARFQMLGTTGWQTLALVVIDIHSVASFHVPLKRGHTYHVRIYLPAAQAGNGYLDGTSHIRAVGGQA